MKTPSPYYSHEPDTGIMIKKDQVEIGNWTDSLEFVNEELEYLLNLEDRLINNAHLYQTLNELRIENQLCLRELYRYEGDLRKAIECDTTECEAYYLDNHEINRTLFVTHLKRYQNTKLKLFSEIPLKAK